MSDLLVVNEEISPPIRSLILLGPLKLFQEDGPRGGVTGEITEWCVDP
jgi:hypothetical protein